MEYIFLTVLFVFGAALGSFISVIAGRYNTGLSFFKGRSLCFSCGHELGRADLVPILSFLFLGGHCRYCDSRIPKETLVVEILMGALSVLAAFKSGIFNLEFTWILATSYLILLAIFAVILLISIYDLKHFIIPDAFLFWLLFFSFLYVSFPSGFKLQASSFISALVLPLPFLVLFLVSKGRWIGLGDVKYMVVIGFLLGLSQGVSAVTLAFWVGATFALFVLLLNKIKSGLKLRTPLNRLTIKSEIPFGPFLSIGVILCLCLQVDLFQIQSLLNVF